MRRLISVLIYQREEYYTLHMNKVLTGLAAEHREWAVASHAGAQALQRVISAKTSGTPNLDELQAVLTTRMH